MVGCYDGEVGPEVPTIGDFRLSQEYMEIDSEGGQYSVDIFTMYDFQYSTDVDWIEVSGGNCGAEYCTLYFNILPNSAAHTREGVITFVSEDYNLTASLRVVQETRQQYPFYITINLEQSRTQIGDKIDGTYPLFWLPEDRIMCNGEVSDGTFVDEYSASIATFAFNRTTTPPYNLVYPAPTNGEVATKEGCYPIVFPAKQCYVKNTFDNGAAPMYGYTSETTTQLQHLSGVLLLTIKGDVTLSHMVISAENGYISGVFDLNCQTGEVTPQTGNVYNTIEYDFGKGLQLNESEATPLYITIPAGGYGNISFFIYSINGDEMMVKFNSSTKPIRAGVVRQFAELSFKPNQE